MAKKSFNPPNLFAGGARTLRSDILHHEPCYESEDVPFAMDGERKTGLESLANRLRCTGEIFGYWAGFEFIHPRFQFDAETGARHRQMREILRTLPQDYSGWRPALWFFQGHASLRDERPCDVYWNDPDAVLRAAILSYGDANRLAAAPVLVPEPELEPLAG